MKKILKIDKNTFEYLQNSLVKLGLDSDKVSFAEIRAMLEKPLVLAPEEFAENVFYVICASGFKQTTAKKILAKIMEYIRETETPNYDDLIKIYANVNKINAILKIWKNKDELQKKYYSLLDDETRIEFLGNLPHIGNITKHHLARNLGMNFVKYDIWIQRLAVGLYGNENDISKIDNGKLNDKIKELCDKMFDDIVNDTGEKRGYIDVVLWKSCQQGLIKIDKNECVVETD